MFLLNWNNARDEAAGYTWDNRIGPRGQEFRSTVFNYTTFVGTSLVAPTYSLFKSYNFFSPGVGGLNLYKFGSSTAKFNVGWKNGDYFLYLPNKGCPKLNWKANYSALRYEMSLGKPIYDSYRYADGSLIETGGFLGAERYTLMQRGWVYNSQSGFWMPPKLKF